MSACCVNMQTRFPFGAKLERRASARVRVHVISVKQPKTLDFNATRCLNIIMGGVKYNARALHCYMDVETKYIMVYTHAGRPTDREVCSSVFCASAKTNCPPLPKCNASKFNQVVAWLELIRHLHQISPPTRRYQLFRV
jgi:hypothetical protein